MIGEPRNATPGSEHGPAASPSPFTVHPSPHSSPLTLVVLAAGLGSRYGGLKQLEPLGPGGATLIDYSLHDGLRAGFTRVVFVIRAEIEAEFERKVGARYRDRFEVGTVCQRVDRVLPGFTTPTTRSLPWGTVHAVLATRALLGGPFAVLNADDLYGPEAIQQAAEFLRHSTPGSTQHAVVGFRLEATGSPSGGVTRAILAHGVDGLLRDVLEMEDLVRTAGGDYEGRLKGESARVEASGLVSMNMWAFRPGIFPVFESAFRRFLATTPGDTAELRISEAVQEGIARREIEVRVLPTTSRWCGVTHPADRDWVRARLEELVRIGVYPQRLWD